MTTSKILQTGNNDEKVKLLQSFFKNSNSMPDETARLTINSLCNDKDIAVRFWAKKVHNEVQKSIHPDSGSTTEPTESMQDRELGTAMLFKKLQDAQSHFVAIEILGKIFRRHNAKDLSALLSYLQSITDTIVIAYLTKNIGIHYPSEELITVLMPYLRHSDDRVVANTIEGLEAIKSPKNIVIFAQLLEHKNHRVRANAAKALSESRPDDAKKVLLKMLEKKDAPHFVLAACAAISAIPSPDFTPYLVEILADPLFFAGALKAIKAIGGKETATYLEAIIEKFEGEKQIQLKAALKEFIPADNHSSERLQDRCDNFDRSTNTQYVAERGKDFICQPRENVLEFVEETRWGKLLTPLTDYLPKYLLIYLALGLFFLASAAFYYVFPFVLFNIVPLLGALVLLLGTFILFLAGIAGLFIPALLGFPSRERAIAGLWGSSFFGFVIFIAVVTIAAPRDKISQDSYQAGARSAEQNSSWFSGSLFGSSLEDKIERGQSFTLEEIRTECLRRSKNNDHEWEKPFSSAMTGKTVVWSGWVNSVDGNLDQQNYQVAIDIDPPEILFSTPEISFIVDEKTASRIPVKTKISFKGTITTANITLSTWHIILKNVEITSGLTSSTVSEFKTLETLAEEEAMFNEEMQKRKAENEKIEEEIIRKLQTKSQLTYDEVCSMLKPVSSLSMRLMEAFQDKTLSGSGWVNNVTGWWAPFTCYVDLDSPSAVSYHVYFEVSEDASKRLKNGSRVSFSGLIKGISTGIFSGSSFLIELKRTNVY